MLKCSFKEEKVAISDGKIALTEGVQFLQDVFDGFTVLPNEGDFEGGFFEAFLFPLGFKIDEQTDEIEEIY